MSAKRLFIIRMGIRLVFVIGVLVVGTVVGARYADGPVGMLAGGPLEAGELVTGAEPDWSFMRDVQEVEFQLLEPPRSRTVWVVYHEGSFYIPCGFLDMPVWKQWPHEAVEDGRALVRVDGRKYERQAVKVTDADEYTAVLKLAAEKYGFDPGQAGPEAMESTWVFRMDPRT